MTQELSRLQCLRNYKGSRVEFLKAEKDDYIENLQMLVYLDGFKNPVFATKLNVFEFYTSTYYQMNRRWANIPFIFDPVKVEVKKIQGLDVEFLGNNSTIEIGEPYFFNSVEIKCGSNNKIKINQTIEIITKIKRLLIKSL